jgi:transcriptional regulator with GAF, ATPase, and Fis domain
VSSEPTVEPATEPPGFDSLFADLSATLVECPIDAIPGHVAAAIGRAAQFFDLDHGWLAQQGGDSGGPVALSFAWGRPGCPSLAPFDPDKSLPWITARLGGGARVNLASPDDFPAQAAPDRAFLRRTGIRSIIGLPLIVGGTPVGWLGFGAARVGRSWSPSVVDALGQIASTVASGLERARADRALGRAIEFDQVLAGLAASLIHVPIDAMDGQIVQTLATLGELLGADRAMVIQDHAGTQISTRTHVWVRAGTIGPPPSDRRDAFPWLAAQVLEGRKIVALTRLDDLPPEAARDRASLERNSVVSGALAPLVVADRVLGSVVFATVTRVQHWSPDLVARLRLVGEILANALLRRETEVSLRLALAENRQLREQLEAENLSLKAELSEHRDFGEIVGRSDALRQVLDKVGPVADTGAPVLILGETGTGKELLARAIHAHSRRHSQPFIAVNCAALPATLIESELFGHEKGAFTGATRDKPGRFELADRGTLLLDEIGDLDPALQTKLLRVLEDGEVQRLGATATRKVDVRIIAATNRDIRRDMREGRFRSDLYYRLGVFPIEVPSLRDRREDIPLLVWHFVESRQRALNRTISSIPKAVMAALQAYDWPGNIRELQNVIERALILSPGSVLRIDDALGPAARAPDDAPGRRAAGEALQDVERAHILAVLDGCRWTIEGRGQAAERLGLNPSTLRNRMRKLGIRRPVG